MHTCTHTHLEQIPLLGPSLLQFVFGSLGGLGGEGLRQVEGSVPQLQLQEVLITHLLNLEWSTVKGH